MSSSLGMTAMPVIHVCNISVVSVDGDKERKEEREQAVSGMLSAAVTAINYLVFIYKRQYGIFSFYSTQGRLVGDY